MSCQEYLSEEEAEDIHPKPMFHVLPSPTYSPIEVCKCIKSQESSEVVIISLRKEGILNVVSKTEEYLRERRIPELIRFLLIKIISHKSHNPLAFLEKLLDDCMLFRAGHAPAPVLYEKRHLEAIIKSFDPGNRGWLTAGQIRRMYSTLGFSLKINEEERVPTEVILNNLIKDQEQELYELLSANKNENGTSFNTE